jgi:hypothetical protein
LRLKREKRKHKAEIKYRDMKELSMYVFLGASIVCAICAVFVRGNV